MKFKIGQSAEIEKKIKTEDVFAFAKLSGDTNPVHLDEVYASKTFFKFRLVHGLLCSSLISCVLANNLPGEGTIYLNQELKFVAPVFHNETLIAKVTIVDIFPNKKQMQLETIVRNKETSQIVIIGMALVKHPEI
jgi:3-hydroxybutyryl-CoA dehydratase